jgi:hypothetical protein
MSEPPKVSTGLEASSWMAYNARDRAELLEKFTQNVEDSYLRAIQAEYAQSVRAELREIAQAVVQGRAASPVAAGPPVRISIEEFERQVEDQYAAVNAAVEMSTDFVKLANDNRLALTGQEIAAPVQELMEDFYKKTAEMPPTPLQQESLNHASEKLGMSEPPKMKTSLESSVWMVQNAPERTERLEELTRSLETIHARQSERQQQARTIEPSLHTPDVGMSID